MQEITLLCILDNTNTDYHFLDCSLPILQAGVRDKTTISYNTALGVIFGVKKYAERLQKVICLMNSDYNDYFY